MDTPGSVLRSEREHQRKSLRDISQDIKINVEYLRAIEDDEYSTLPAPVFIKSYIRLYADALGFEGDSVVRYYENYIASDIPEEPVAKEKKSIRPRIELPHKSTIVRPALIIVILIAIVSAIYVLTSNNAVTDIQTESKNDYTALNTGTPAETTGQSADELSITIIATELTWVSIGVDGSKPKEWLLRPQQSITLSAMDKFAIKVGNAGGTRLLLNDEDLGTLGPYGKVVDIVLP